MTTRNFPGYPIEVGDSRQITDLYERAQRGYVKLNYRPLYPVHVSDTEGVTKLSDGSYNHPVHSSQVVVLEEERGFEWSHPVSPRQVVDLTDLFKD
ncbi:MAG: hypothetical protein Q7K45_04490 [Nanoarchaeota archaeon]|nr:hypothetical protein [Nanoarchaeota archaeon]